MSAEEHLVLHRLEVEVEAELRVLQSAMRTKHAPDPGIEWFSTPATSSATGQGLYGLLGAVHAVEGHPEPHQPIQQVVGGLDPKPRRNVTRGPASRSIDLLEVTKLAATIDGTNVLIWRPSMSIPGCSRLSMGRRFSPSSSRLRLTTAAGRRCIGASGTGRRTVWSELLTRVALVMTGPGQDFSEASTSGFELTALEPVAAPTCPPGPVAMRCASSRSVCRRCRTLVVSGSASLPLGTHILILDVGKGATAPLAVPSTVTGRAACIRRVSTLGWSPNDRQLYYFGGSVS